MNDQKRHLGLIGRKLSHSFSKSYFTQKLEELELDHIEYNLYELSDIQEFLKMRQSVTNLVGLNVTIPYKSDILQYVDQQDDVVKALGATNTLHFKEGKIWAHNTDVIGFRKLLEKVYDLTQPKKRALVFGTGGSSKAVDYVLSEANIDFTLVSRKEESSFLNYEDLTAEDLREVDLLINCTPVGMYPNVDDVLPIPTEGFHRDQVFIDLVYNPSITSFIKLGLGAGAIAVNGLEMLHAQAEASWEIWYESLKVD